MAFSAPIARFARLSWRDRMLLAEALATLAAASLAIRVLPFRSIAAFAARPPRRQGEADVARLRWAVQACRRRVRWRAVCFQSGLALHAMLRRRGVPSVLHYGIAKESDAEIKAHVWLSVGGEVVLGGAEATGYACVASFPPQEG
ncbi:lasso peptide biosynthesis B2 protein [Allosphingosinicella sp.]|jgi:hypothetical protein|uniref:lasso peptide biosynthesis B2 protein n=1 Tax=Allosphingosinicella sp. TaxID=2823234 RepID=UPI002EF7D365